MLQTYQETRRRFFDHPAVRIEGAAARAARNCRTPEALTPELQIVLTLRGAFMYELGSAHLLLTANHALFIAAGDISRDRFVDDQPLDYMLVTPHVDAVNAMLSLPGSASSRVRRESAVRQRNCNAKDRLCGICARASARKTSTSSSRSSSC